MYDRKKKKKKKTRRTYVSCHDGVPETLLRDEEDLTKNWYFNVLTEEVKKFKDDVSVSNHYRRT